VENGPEYNNFSSVFFLRRRRNGPVGIGQVSGSQLPAMDAGDWDSSGSRLLYLGGDTRSAGPAVWSPAGPPGMGLGRGDIGCPCHGSFGTRGRGPRVQGSQGG